ncbi:amino acid ABC transporter ATP-binding protein [Streptococcus loxodontisalivarius]|uniref:ABC-type polar amino acid transport system ATPase subunit n=1 Tax=Streptococcus loxodontisalivarius TaxID=1349415 RepID=A0ABS2PRL2_9STRE|nr:amino acid ABC transporter ATP-binding protein [Streptococcus loxodontisalivarius]MBM7642669.1 ABC-type polar amino acid transport system ATPase subunit [Streptococcus loxodontisalivarius]
MISISHLNQTISGNTILKDVSLDLPKGEVVSIIGPSGAGKTTLIRCLNLLNIPDSGEIAYDDKVIRFPKVGRNEAKEIRQNTAMVFQEYALFINKTVLQNITEGLTIARNVKASEAKEVAEKLLKKVGLYDKRHAYPHHLSGGQQQRVGIARALALDSDVILFDEPTSALDPETIGDILDLIQEIAQENPDKSIVIVTHEMQFAHDISDRVVFMEKGQVVDSGTPEAIFHKTENPRIKTFLRRVRYQ